MMKKFFLLALVCILPLWGIAQNATVDVVPTSNKAAKTVDITTSLAPEAAYVQTVAQQNYFKPVSLPKGNIAYAMSHYGGPALGYVSFDVDNAAGTMATVSSLSITPYGGEFYNEVWYCYTNDNTFYKINYQTGEIMSQISSTNEWVVDMAYDYSTSTMYGTKSGILYSIDLETGACTTIGTLSATLMTLAVDHSGAMYGISITDGNFYSVDKTTAACTLIGATGQGCNYVQSMGFDHNSGVLYWCGYSSAGNFFTIDVATGAATQISAGIGECTSFFVPFVDNPAIASAPTNFTATPQGTDLVCNLSWTNPSTNIGGGTLTGITKMVLKRNGTVIQELTPAGVGATMTYTDSDFPNGAGTYSYSVYAVTSEGNGQSTNASAVIGDMCNVVIEMFDSWGDGWNGAGITVSANGTTYGTASLSSGTTGTATILVPPATIDFTWVAGSWDSECSFNIYDGYSVLLYASAGPGAGTFFSWENTCTAPEAATINGTVTSLAGGAAIADATITYAGILGGAATTDVSGNYSIEVLAGYTYNITVEAAGYNKITETGYTAVAGTTTKNYAMTNPIIGVTPTTVEVTTSYGINGTAELQISNTGNGPLNFGNSIAYTAGKAANEAWDLVASFTATAAGMQGVATDGQYIYLTSWQASPTAGHSFEKYDLDLNFVEGFDISGVSQLRDLTYDGTYFYGGSGSTLYCLDLANQTLVSSVSTGVSTIRHCSYDPENDGFWVGNWSDLYRINRAGVVQVTGPAPESAYGSGYDDITEGGPYLLLFCQPNSNALVYRYNIATNTIESTPIFDFAATPGYNAGISGGAFVGNYDGKICFFGNMQQDPNLIGIYELGLAGWLTMTPGSGTIAAGGTTTATLTMDGWWAQEGTFNATLNVTSSSPNVGSVPVDVTFIIVAPDCDAPTNPAAEVEDFNNIILTWTAPAGNVATYNIYYGNDMTPFATVNGNVTTYTDENLAPGQYCYVIRALYSDGCLSLGTTAVCEIAVEPYGTLTGVVRDAGNNSPISGATVRVGSAANEVTTDASGEYSIDVLTGTYDVRFTAEGYTTYTEEGYVLGIGTHTLNANLEAAGTCDPVGNMTAENTGNNVVHIAWTAPGAGSGEEALLPQYCGEYDNNAIGTGAAADFECMHKWLANAISDYEGWTVTKIAFVPHQTTSAFYIKAYVGTGATPETNILDQSVPTFTAGMWNEIEVETSVVIEEGMNFWAGYRAVPTTGHPAGVDAGPAMAGQGNIMYFSGEWTTLLDLGSTLNYNWCIKVTVQDAKGNVKNLALEPNMPADMGGVLSVTNNPSAKDDVILNETFETGAIPTGWTNTDADGDGYLWDAETGLGLFVGHSGECISSASYINYVGALTPDNWLITPVLDGPGSVNYWVNAQDAAYAYEHYGVYASTSGTNPGDFTLLFEETMTAKGEKYAGLRGGSKEQGAWYERTVENIPSGTKYIAFRHFNCTDAFWLNLDDVTIYGGGGSGSGAGALTGYKIYREGTEIASVGVNILSYDDNFYSDNMDVEYCVTAVYENCESEEACAEVTIIGIENYSNISIYPNPASSTVTIGAENVTSVYVYNNLGQLVSKLGATNSVDVKAYAPGVYYFTINTADGASVNAKIVVTR
ncbi:MAG: choice-of-anchor J domain-containing protein [Bacteroidales bacterium]|nr:choice-of-anchor J domain-containing protein [Bacteroidales bacterium]